MVLKSNILYAELNEFTDNTTGVVTQMTKIVYTIEREATEKAVGCAILEAYKPGNFLKELERYTLPSKLMGKETRELVNLEIDKQYTKNGEKYVVKKVNDFDFKKK